MYKEKVKLRHNSVCNPRFPYYSYYDIPLLCIIINDYAHVINRFNVSRPQVTRLSADHMLLIHIGQVSRHDKLCIIRVKNNYGIKIERF